MSETTTFQTGVEVRPELTVEARSAADVQDAVRAAATRGLTVRTLATGHGAGASITDGVLIRTAGLDRVSVDPATRTARVGAGASWGSVVEAAAAHGLVAPAGSAPSVGVAGYLLGGGHPILGRTLGYGSDHVRSLDVVTAGGDLVHVTATSDPDLFRALRGGRDGLGVVTAVEFGLTELNTIHAGSVALDVGAGGAGAVVAEFLAAAGALPEEVTATAGMVPMPDLDMVPEPLRGRHVLTVRTVATREDEAARALLDRVAGVAPVLMRGQRQLPPTESGTIYNEPPFPHAYVGDSVFLADLDPAAADALGPDAAVGTVMDLRVLGGALARPPRDPDVVPNREARYLLRAVAMLLDEVTPAAARKVQREAFAVAGPALGRSLNFVYGDGIDADPAAPVPASVPDVFPPATRHWLRELIAERDPAGRFGGNRFA